MDAVQVVAGRLSVAIQADKNEEEIKKLDELKEDHEGTVKTFSGKETLNFLKQEQVRLEKLAFWDDVPELKDMPKVWHFHPVAFVEYAGSSSIPPWLVVAMEEAKKWANITEDKITTNYHAEVGYIYGPSLVGTANAWCASFVN